MRRDGGERLRRCACATYLPGALSACAYLPGVCACAPTYRLPTYLPGKQKAPACAGAVCALCVCLALRETVLPKGEGQQVERFHPCTAASDSGGAIVPGISGGGEPSL